MVAIVSARALIGCLCTISCIAVIGSHGALKMVGTCPADSSLQNPLPVPANGLPFCDGERTRQSSCCTAQDTLAIEKTVNELMRDDCPTCKKLVREWKCAECDPEASSFYAASSTECDHDTTLKLCETYCHLIFEVCKDIPFSIDDSPFFLNDPADLDADEWCESLIAAEPHCFQGSYPDEIGSLDKNCRRASTMNTDDTFDSSFDADADEDDKENEDDEEDTIETHTYD